MIRTRSLILLATAGMAAAAALAAARRSRDARRIAAAAVPDRAVLEQPPLHHEIPQTYQELLDESLYLTFPASDPICAQAAMHCGEAIDSPANASDWRLHRDSTAPDGAPRH